jgi:galactitol-specific phosphotransferase system IIC component
MKLLLCALACPLVVVLAVGLALCFAALIYAGLALGVGVVAVGWVNSLARRNFGGGL